MGILRHAVLHMTDNVTFTLHEKWVEDCSSFVAQFPLTHICAVCDCDAITGKKEEAFFFLNHKACQW